MAVQERLTPRLALINYVEVLASSPNRVATYRLAAVKCLAVAACVVSDEVRRELEELSKRCAQLGEHSLSVAGMKAITTGDVAALRKLTRDPRVLERLGV